MSIYLRSRGKSRDYTWLEPHSKSEKDPDQYLKILQALDGEYPSLVIFRYKGASDEKKLILFISNCISHPARRDFQNRIIRDFLFWDVEDNLGYDEQIRAIAAATLENCNRLQQIFAEVIDFPTLEENENSRGFDCKDGKLEEELNKFAEDLKKEFVGSPKQELLDKDNDKWAKESDTNRKTLANELRSLDRLPDREGFLVVVTGSKSEANLEKFDVWRAMSKLVKSEQWQPQQMDGSRRNSTSFLGNLGNNLPGLSKMATTSLAIAVIFCIVIVANSYTCGLQIQKTLNPQNPTLPDRCHYLQIPKLHPPQPTPIPAPIEEPSTPQIINSQDLQYLLENLEPAQIKEAFDRLPPNRKTTLLNTLQ